MRALDTHALGGGGGPSVARGDQILLEQTVRGDHLSQGTINFVTGLKLWDVDVPKIFESL